MARYGVEQVFTPQSPKDPLYTNSLKMQANKALQHRLFHGGAAHLHPVSICSGITLRARTLIAWPRRCTCPSTTTNGDLSAWRLAS